MNKTKKITTGLFAVCLAAFSGALVGCKDKTKEYTAEYGDTFALPALTQAYVVKDSNGNKIEVANGAFYVGDINGYTVDVGDEENAIRIKVQDTTAPEINVEKEITYVKTGSKVNFGEVFARDAYDGKIIPNAAVVTNGESVETQLEGFTPQEDGTYEIMLTATDSFDNVAKKSIYVEASADGKNGYKVANFSTVYGDKLIEAGHGITVERSVTEKYGDEAGSVKITSTYDIDQASWSNYFTLKNLAKEDVRLSHGIRFYIKSKSAMSKTLKIGDVLLYSVNPGEWTEIYVSPNQMENIDATLHNGKTAMEDLTAFKFEFVTPQISRTGADEFYLSDIEYLPYLDFYTFRDRLKALGGTLEKTEEAEWTYLSRVWASYTQPQKTAVNNLGYVNRTHFDGMYPQDILDMLWLNASAGENFARQGDKVVYCDSELGVKQFTSPDNSASLKYVAKAELPQSVLNVTSAEDVTESGVMRIRTGDAWGATLNLSYPVVGNDWLDALWSNRNQAFPADKYTTQDLDVDEDSIYWKIKFKLYADPAILGKRDIMCSFNNQRVLVPTGEWTEVEFDVRNKTLKNSTLYFYGANDSSYMNWISGAMMYMTSIEATRVPTQASVVEAINNYVDNGVGTKEEVMAQFKALSPIKRTSSSVRNAATRLIDHIQADLGVSTDDKTALDFNSALGLEQISCLLGDVEILTDVVDNKYFYGEETGVLKMTLNASAWEVGFYPLLPLNVDASNGYTFYVYMEGSNGKKINFTSWSVNNEEFYLTEGEWTKFQIPAGTNLGEDYIFAYCEDWLQRLPTDITLYISAVKAE